MAYSAGMLAGLLGFAQMAGPLSMWLLSGVSLQLGYLKRDLKRESKPCRQMLVSFIHNVCIMYADVPLARASHMPSPESV